MFTNRLATAAGGLAVLLLAAGCGEADERPDGSRLESADSPPVSSGDRPSTPGARLARELGCGACHGDLPGPGTARDRAPAFGEGGRSYEPDFLLSYLQSPASVRADIGRTRMPDFHLSEAEAVALSLFLLERSGRRDSSGDEFRRAREAHPEADAGRGRRIYRALNCAGCHRGTDVDPWIPGPGLTEGSLRARPGWLRSWLAEPRALRPFGFHPGTGSRMPDFRMTDAEADTLADYLLAAGRAGSRPDARPSVDDSLASLSAFERRKAETLLRDRHSCLGCHRLDGGGGRIGPALDAVAERRPEAYLQRVLAHPDSAAPGTVMPRIPMTADRRDLLAAYLADLDSAGVSADDARSGYLSLVEHPLRVPAGAERGPAGTEESPGGSDRAARPEGEELYRQRCASCHGAAGAADGFNARYLPSTPAVHASADSMARRTDGVLFDGVWAGGRVLDRSHRMPPFGGSLSRGQTWSLVEHVRELCDCRGPAWSGEGTRDGRGGGR